MSQMNPMSQMSPTSLKRTTTARIPVISIGPMIPGGPELPAMPGIPTAVSANPPRPRSLTTQRIPVGPAQVRRVLVVDDEPRLAQLFETVLRAEGYEVFTAASGPQALAIAAEVQPAAILLDVVMPGMDGIAALKELRRQGHQCQVVVMTAQGTLRTAREAMALGAFEYLTKPFKLDHLKAVIRESVAYQRTSQIGRSCVP